MLERTYQKVEALSSKYHGYVSTRTLLDEGITNRQIAMLVDEEWLERVSHGHYWLMRGPYEKPADYKAIEICNCNPRAVICAESACYYGGLIDVEPKAVVIATQRSNRGKITVKFPFVRHYFVDKYFDPAMRKVTTDFGDYSMYGIERSICDCIRMQGEMEEDIFDLIVEKYRKRRGENTKLLLEYAKLLRIESQVKDLFAIH